MPSDLLVLFLHCSHIFSPFGSCQKQLHFAGIAPVGLRHPTKLLLHHMIDSALDAMSREAAGP